MNVSSRFKTQVYGSMLQQPKLAMSGTQLTKRREYALNRGRRPRKLLPGVPEFPRLGQGTAWKTSKRADKPTSFVQECIQMLTEKQKPKSIV
jgi:hypothetical protein